MSELISIGMMWHFYGSVMTGVALVIVAALASIGRLLRGIRLLPQFVGILTLQLFASIVHKSEWRALLQSLQINSLSYSGFFAHLVRGMLLCCDFSKEKEKSSWLSLLSRSVGFVAFTNVFTPASFIIFQDWVQWRDERYEYEWKGPFKMACKRVIGKATVLRKLSFLRLLLRCLRVFFWFLVHRYILFAINPEEMLLEGVERTTRHRSRPADCALLAYAAYLLCAQFNTFYVIFYNLSRLVGDIQQFLLSPAFSSNTLQKVKGDPKAERAWKEASFVERWARVEVEEECLMPEGPCCIMVAFNSSDIWRRFDVGLYNVLKHYIYIPWMQAVEWMFGRNEVAESGSTKNIQPCAFVKNFEAILGALFTFIFVLTFHKWTPGNCLWVSISFTLWVIERFVTQAVSRHHICETIKTRLSPAWEQRIRCAVFTFVELLNCSSFLCFITSYTTGIFFMKMLLTEPRKVEFKN